MLRNTAVHRTFICSGYCFTFCVVQHALTALPRPRYIQGAVMLQLMVLSIGLNACSASAAPSLGFSMSSFCALAGRGRDSTLPHGLFAPASMLSFFLGEYCWNELVHTFTYDLFRERIGFKLLFGCLFFYPFFYAVALLPFASPPPFQRIDLLSPSASDALCVSLFLCGWMLTRGANMQKFACKSGAKSFFGHALVFVPGSQNRLCMSLFWGWSRHINYLGEILQAFGIALASALATSSATPFLYPIYYVALFLPRIADDDNQCRSKYGEAVWQLYCQRVPSKLIPKIY
jgi:protein-S-isoprenylcysteine O-methyltransferase Ste14